MQTEMETQYYKKHLMIKSKALQQGLDIGVFDLIRNLKKTIILSIVVFAFFLLFLILEEVQISKNGSIPDTPYDYFSGFIGIIPMLVIICSSSYGGPLISVDFEYQTGNLIFPKISRNRLFVGRFIANYLMNSMIIAFYYLCIAIAVLIRFKTIPSSLMGSLLWALLYTLAVLSFSTFFSSIMGSSAGAIVIVILLLLIGFSIVIAIMSFTTTIEPLFILVYLGNIITACFNMPIDGNRVDYFNFDPESGGMTRVQSPSDSGLTMTTWNHPSYTGAFWGLVIHSIVFISFSYYFFRKRELKQN